ncbi:TonB-dependent vitamin B12 receptor [Thiohalobacter sp. IOR34]|uniref:TonB-dependent vitamin B12 receptor n=1 Tax=Thiohalobacter sp. IOR34 TaxID=3057176 RepID=UPI0025AF219A|nr:TonB-dependent vitamin B12 receptor [Thiohalobacter sp. IOR34]WJW75151.1 TonB-dependent vitamin B12 receptor [Thiohalobacter sp. IOR34]
MSGNRFTPLITALASVMAAPLQAAEPADPIIVTATRTAQTVDASLASVTVIGRADIERLQAQSVEELLAGVAGIDIANNGGRGKNTSLFLRGTESDHVLVLIDGLRVGSATTGQAAFQDFPVDQIERIEIVRGPRSALYGSEAIGGVIQIFTRKGDATRRPELGLSAGSHQTYKLGAAISGGDQDRWYSLSLSGEDTEGFNACTGSSTAFAGCYTEEPDDDGYRNLSLNLRGGLRFGKGASLDLHLLRVNSDVEFDGSFQNEAEGVQQVLGAGLELPLGEIGSLRLKAGQSRDESDNFKDGSYASTFDTRRNSLSLQADFGIGDSGLLSLGADYYDDKVTSSASYAVDSRDNKGLFLQYQGRLGNHDLQVALRRDDDQQFGNHTTGSIAVGHDFADSLRLTASYGTAFKAPTFNELYYPGYGNANLRPEESRSIELGLSGRSERLRWSASLYQTRIDDLIAYDSSLLAPNNISEARIRGLEVDIDGQWFGWQTRTSLTLADPEHRGNDSNRGNQLPRRAKRSLRLDLDRDFGRLRAGATLRAVGKRYDNLANSRELGGYATLDLRLRYGLARDWTLGARLGNLFDRDYQLASYYPQDGRNLLLTLAYRPQR